MFFCRSLARHSTAPLCCHCISACDVPVDNDASAGISIPICDDLAPTKSSQGPPAKRRKMIHPAETSLDHGIEKVTLIIHCSVENADASSHTVIIPPATDSVARPTRRCSKRTVADMIAASAKASASPGDAASADDFLAEGQKNLWRGGGCVRE